MVRILRNSRMDSVKRAAIFFIAFPPSTDIGPQKEIMGLSSAAARCGLYTASRTGFSSNRQLSVLPALNAYKPTLHILFFCFVSHYSSAACNIQFIFQENLSWSAQLSKKGTNLFFDSSLSNRVLFSPIPLTLRTGCYTALHKKPFCASSVSWLPCSMI